MAQVNMSMLFACWAIVIVLAAMEITFLRARKPVYAVAVLPLGLSPVVYIVSGRVARACSGWLPLESGELMLVINLTAGLVACLLLGLTSRRIEPKRVRTAFHVCCSLFVVILTLVLVIRTMLNLR